MTEAAIDFFAIHTQTQRLRTRLDSAMARVLDHAQFIMGPEVAELEARLAAYCGARHCVTCSDGTTALTMALMAWSIGPGDAVFVPSFTFVATAEAPALLGATPVFVDVRADTFTLDSDSLEAAVATAQAAGLRPAAVIPVDLYGHPVDRPAIDAVARRHGLRVLNDAAQAFGASLAGVRVGAWSDATAVSFFPSKPLGCLGDGGAVFTDDDATAAALRSIRMHGKRSDKYDNVRLGLNARLDTVQAAVLLEKLAVFDDELARRRAVAARYTTALEGVVTTPSVAPDAAPAWALYTVQAANRAAVEAACAAAGVPTRVYYPTPLHRQPGYEKAPRPAAGCPVAEDLARHALSLPMHPYLEDAQVDRIAAAVRAASGA